MKTVEQKIYLLASQTGNNISKTDNLIVCLNGERSEIKLVDLFKHEYTQTEESVKGYSLLSLYELREGMIVVKFDESEVDVSLINKNTDEQIFFSRIKNPLFQMPDKKLEEETFLFLIFNEVERLEVLKNKKENTAPIEVNTPESNIALEEEDDDEEKEEQKGLKIEEEEEEEEIIEKEPVNLPENKPKQVFQGYSNELETLKKSGYKEHILENYRLLYNEQEKKMIFLEVEDDNYNRANYTKLKNGDTVEITLENGTVLIFDYIKLIAK